MWVLFVPFLNAWTIVPAHLLAANKTAAILDYSWAPRGLYIMGLDKVIDLQNVQIEDILRFIINK